MAVESDAETTEETADPSGEPLTETRPEMSGYGATDSERSAERVIESRHPASRSLPEDLIEELAQHYTVLIVAHNMQQAARTSDMTAVFLTGGELVEFDETGKTSENPDHHRVEDYITGKFG